MITTVCMNPSFDKTVEVDAMSVGEVNRIRTSRVDMGGKGINVAVVAQRLGLDVCCTGCMGRDGAARLTAMMDAEGLKHAFLTVDGSVRTNTKIVSRDGAPVTELNEPGPAMTEQTLDEFFDLAVSCAEKSEYAVITGSLPPACPAGTYRELIRRMNIPCILDVGGQELLLGLEAHPFLIKPNRPELEQTVGRALPTLADVIDAARELQASGAQNVLVSLGGDGAVLITADKAYLAPAIPVKVRSTVGAGDSMVGGVLAGLAAGGGLTEALRCGAAAGTASVMTEGTQLIVPEQFRALLAQAEVQEV